MAWETEMAQLRDLEDVLCIQSMEGDWHVCISEIANLIFRHIQFNYDWVSFIRDFDAVFDRLPESAGSILLLGCNCYLKIDSAVNFDEQLCKSLAKIVTKEKKNKEKEESKNKLLQCGRRPVVVTPLCFPNYTARHNPEDAQEKEGEKKNLPILSTFIDHLGEMIQRMRRLKFPLTDEEFCLLRLWLLFKPMEELCVETNKLVKQMADKYRKLLQAYLKIQGHGSDRFDHLESIFDKCENGYATWWKQIAKIVMFDPKTKLMFDEITYMMNSTESSIATDFAKFTIG